MIDWGVQATFKPESGEGNGLSNARQQGMDVHFVGTTPKDLDFENMTDAEASGQRLRGRQDKVRRR